MNPFWTDIKTKKKKHNDKNIFTQGVVWYYFYFWKQKHKNGLLLIFFNEKNKTNYYQKFLKHFIFWEFFKIVGFYIFLKKEKNIFYFKIFENKNGNINKTHSPKQKQNNDNFVRQWLYVDGPHLCVEVIAHESWPIKPIFKPSLLVCFKTIGNIWALKPSIRKLPC
jgi:hypothetical protein